MWIEIQFTNIASKICVAHIKMCLLIFFNHNFGQCQRKKQFNSLEFSKKYHVNKMHFSNIWEYLKYWCIRMIQLFLLKMNCLHSINLHLAFIYLFFQNELIDKTKIRVCFDLCGT
jgi:hypothetical protein